MKTVIKGELKKIEEYFLSDNLSQSKLKKLLVDIDCYLEEKEKEDKEHFIIGSVVDTLLTCNDNVFDKQFFVYTSDNLPSLVERKVIDNIYNKLKQESKDSEIKSLDNYTNLILEVIDDLSWQKNWKDKTRVDKIKIKGAEYFNLLKEAKNRTIISNKNMEIVKNVLKSLLSNSRTRGFFTEEEKDNNRDLEFYYQYPIYFVYKGIPCKALLDLVIVEKTKHSISTDKIISVQGFDLKTTSDKTTNFLHSVKKFRYDIQAAWYTKALESAFNIDKNKYIKIKPFTFIVESITRPGQPLLYEVTEELLHIGKFGREPLEKEHGNTKWLIRSPIKGYNILLDDLLYYLYENKTEFEEIEDKMISESKGKLLIGWDNVYSPVKKYYL